MKNRILFGLVFLFSMIGVNCSAQSYEVRFEEKPNFLVVCEYDGALISNMQVITPAENETEVHFNTDAEKFSSYLVYESEVKKADVKEKTEEVITETPDTMEEPEKEDNDTTSKKDFPDVYDIEKDAIRALMVVNSVSSIYDGGEDKTELSVFFYGEERIYQLPEEITIDNVPENYEHLKGAAAKSLKKGDIIRLTAAFSGQIDGLSLIFRPTNENPVFSETDFGAGFSKLFSSNGIVAGESSYKVSTYDTGVVKSGYAYAFGVIKERYNNELEICDKNGNVMIIDIADGAVIYTVDKDEKFSVERGALSSIRRSRGAKESFDGEGNFLGWSEDANYGYAFLRTIDGDATEVVIYENY